MSSVRSPLMVAATQPPAHSPVMGSAPAGVSALGSNSSYFALQHQHQPHQQHQQHQQHLPARSPYTDSHSFMPSTQQPTVRSVDDERTARNTIANSQTLHTDGPNTATANTNTVNTVNTVNATTAGVSPPHRDASNYASARPNSAIDVAAEAAGHSLANNTAMAANNYTYATSVPAGAVLATPSANPANSANATASRFAENWDASQRGSSIIDGEGSTFGDAAQLASRSNTLKKKTSTRRASSLHRSSSRRSMRAGSVRSLALQSRSDPDEVQSAFYCPVPTKGNPTDLLAHRFQDLISYHREIQNHYEQRAKSLQRLSTTLNGSTLPPGFMTTGGLDDASQMLRSFHKQAMAEAVKAREIEEEVILALTGLRSDLSQKVKEIKNISGDFRNSVDKEMDATKKAVKSLQDSLGQIELDPSLTTGRQDPYLLRLAADRQLERQIQEENYLHQAFLNLERSGRELESIVVGEIQKSYNAYASILRREAAATYATVDELRAGPIAMPKDEEWAAFIRDNDQFVDPEIPIRSYQFITYPGQHHFACQEIRAGLLERKTKYLKSYTAGWYVLTPTHLHEFKSADKAGAPIMSLYLPDQKLGTHSLPEASSSKFALKGRQTGGLHRGHNWIFRAESYDTMMAWYQDIHALTETSPEERENYARGQLHTRSVSRASQRTYSSDGAVNEDDDEPFAAQTTAAGGPAADGDIAGAAAQALVVDGATGAAAGAVAGAAGESPYGSQSEVPMRRPSQGGRFPSDLQVNAQRGLEVQAAGIPVSPTSAAGSGSQHGSGAPDADYAVIAAAGALPGSQQQQHAVEPYQNSQDGYAEPQSVQPVAPAVVPTFLNASDVADASDAPAVNGASAVGDRSQSTSTANLVYPVGAAEAPAENAYMTSAVVEKTNRVLNGGQSRPPLKSRQASEAPTLGSELHMPGEFP